MEQTNVRLVDRVLDVMETLARYPNGVTIATLTAETGIHKSTIYRLLTTLVNRGYVIKDQEGSTYRMTLRTYRIGSSAVPSFDLLDLSKNALRELCQVSREAVHLAIPDGATIVYLFKEVSSENVLRISSRTGSYNYMYYTGLGKALMACMSSEEVKTIWENSEIQKFTPNTITDFHTLLKELEETRKRGYAVDNEEHEMGIGCIADVVRDADNRAIAAISISTLTVRMDENFLIRTIPLLHKTAQTISAMLGYVPSEEHPQLIYQ